MWFSARILSRAEVEDSRTEAPLCEESIRLIDAPDEASARLVAEELGLSEEHSYHNAEGHLVRWVFAGVLDLQELTPEQPGHGAEVYSRLLYETELAQLEDPHRRREQNGSS